MWVTEKYIFSQRAQRSGERRERKDYAFLRDTHTLTQRPLPLCALCEKKKHREKKIKATD
jgi:hypothetical protein